VQGHACGKTQHPCEYYVKGQRLFTIEEKDLGHVYNKESETQCHTAEARATAELHQLKKNCHNRDRKTFVKLYK
jgi:hypothetical protein